LRINLARILRALSSSSSDAEIVYKQKRNLQRYFSRRTTLFLSCLRISLDLLLLESRVFLPHLGQRLPDLIQILGIRPSPLSSAVYDPVIVVGLHGAGALVDVPAYL